MVATKSRIDGVPGALRAALDAFRTFHINFARVRHRRRLAFQAN